MLSRVLLACILPFMFLAVAPVTFYFGNANEISFSLKELILPVSGLFLGTSAIFCFILWLFRRKLKIFVILSGILFGLSLAVWIQSQLFVWDFGLLNGQKIYWDHWKPNMYLEGFVWCLVVAGSMVFFLKKKNKSGVVILSGVYLVGLLSTGTAWIAAPEKAMVPISESEYGDIFAFHPERNVLVILLDTYQSDYFELIAKQYPEDISFLDGFTFYRNNASKFPTTKGSLPSILTGEIYRNDQPFNDYFNKSHDKFNLIDAYKKMSYRSHMVGLAGTTPGVVPMNTVVGKFSEDYVHPVYEYMDYALFRSLPTFFKPGIYNTGKWYLSFYRRKNYPPGHFGTDIRFMELFEKTAMISREQGVKGSFKFFHFSLPHAPSMVDENMQFNTRLSGPEGYLRQARGTIKLAGHIVSVLKKLGIYDSSEIAIISDHGTMNTPQATETLDSSDVLSPVTSSVRTSSHALLLHKPAGSKGALISNDVPMELSDLACLLGLREWDGTDKAKRSFYYYEWDDDWDNDYMPDMTEYFISGHVFQKSSYSKSQFVYTSKGVIRKPLDKPYLPGVPVLFSAGGESSEYIRGGWSVQEPDFRWTEGTTAGLSFHLKNKPQKDLVLRLWGDGFREDGSKDYQKVKVVVNGTPVTKWDMSSDNIYKVPIPASLVPDGKIDIIFECSSPRKIPVDVRHIAMLVRKLVIEEK